MGPSVALPATSLIDSFEVRTCATATLFVLSYVSGIMKSRTAAEQDGVEKSRSFEKMSSTSVVDILAR